jgi:hypothetical protein
LSPAQTIWDSPEIEKRQDQMHAIPQDAWLQYFVWRSFGKTFRT